MEITKRDQEQRMNENSTVPFFGDQILNDLGLHSNYGIRTHTQMLYLKHLRYKVIVKVMCFGMLCHTDLKLALVMKKITKHMENTWVGFEKFVSGNMRLKNSKNFKHM